SDHFLEVPLDHREPKGAKITIYAREVVAIDQAAANLPYLVFLQGGPGSPSPRPQGLGGWVGHMASRFRVLLLDQRGTGRSTPIHTDALAVMGTPQEQADYLAHFRMDSIVADCELLRAALLPSEEPWTVLGQSFGGFCATHYLSVAPQALREVWITGGLPGLDTPIDEIYRWTYRRMAEKNLQYYRRYPGDEARVRHLAAHLMEHEVELPGGSRFSVDMLQQLGAPFGMSDGFDQVHYLIENAFPAGSARPLLHFGFLREVENFLHFDTNPIYALLHEGCYTQGFASNWSAQRVKAEFPAFDQILKGPFFFTAEMIVPSMFDDHAALRPVAEAADILAQKADWPKLYDPARLAKNKVPVAAAVYHDDAYVPRELSLATAARIPNLRTWITNEYEHNGLRADGPRIVDRLCDMTRGRV
ncbi:MAG TPA: alpha/beta fold hydrolase, partial [Planctomycetota bacterium]|nr:alpha/beta fold hydrolase [Planctomycetota bacterium]